MKTFITGLLLFVSVLVNAQTVYQVKSGDTFSEICVLMNVQWDDMDSVKLANVHIKDFNLIGPGDYVIIPEELRSFRNIRGINPLTFDLFGKVTFPKVNNLQPANIKFATTLTSTVLAAPKEPVYDVSGFWENSDTTGDKLLVDSKWYAYVKKRAMSDEITWYAVTGALVGYWAYNSYTLIR